MCIMRARPRTTMNSLDKMYVRLEKQGVRSYNENVKYRGFLFKMMYTRKKKNAAFRIGARR